MKSFLHAFRLTFRRFRWEILGFWILSIWVVSSSAACEVPLERAPFRALRFANPGQSRLEILAMCWLMLRFGLSEPVFLTQGGWRTRPIGRAAAWGASFAVLAVALLPSLLGRLIAIQCMTNPDARVWGDLFKHTFFWGMLFAVLAAVGIRLGGGLLWGRHPGPVRRGACGVVAILVAATWLHPAMARFFRGGYSGVSWSGSGGSYSYGGYLPGLIEHLPAGAKFIQAGGPPYAADSFQPLREILRMSPVAGAEVKKRGVAVKIVRTEVRGGELEIEAEITLVREHASPRARTPLLMLHLPGKRYSFRQKGGIANGNYPLHGFPLGKVRYEGRYDSGEESPDWKRLLPQAELLVFDHDTSRPGFAYTPTKEDIKSTEPERKEEQVPALPPGVAGEVIEIFNVLDNSTNWDKHGPSKERAKTIPREGMPEVLARRPWSDTAWDAFVRPFLLQHATEAEKADLLERMKSEPRLGEIFIAKGWKEEAMPLLRRFAKEHLPLDAVSLGALLDEKDPELAADLAALVTRLPGDLSAFELRLRGYPGLDWEGFVKEGWRLRKYAFRIEVKTEPFDVWAAEEGDATAFRFVAERAARREEGYEAKLRRLLAVEVEDPVALVRANLAQMRYDAASQRWHAADPKP